MKDATRRWWAMGAISLSVLVVGLDLTVLSLALPTIATSMHASTSDLQWITDSYSLVIAALILPAGLLGDAYGRKKMILGALLVFVASSVWCAYSVSIGELIAARAVLGIGAAALFPMALAVIPAMFRQEEQQRATALMAGAVIVAYPIGPILGGLLLDHFWWGSVFLINVPVVAIALVAVAVLLPESHAATSPGFDFPGIVISSAGLAALTYGFIRAGEQGWTDAFALAMMCCGAVILVLFLAWERAATRRAAARGRSMPLVDLPLFGVAGFRWGTILMTTVSFAMFGLMFTVPQYFQEVLGTSPLGSGTRMLPMIGGLLVGLVVGGRLSNPRARQDGSPGEPPVSAKVMVTAGFTVMAAGLVIGAFTGRGSTTGFAALWVTTTGVGLGFAMPSAMAAAIGPLSAERSGSGSALISAVRQVGATIGVAVLGTILSNGYTSRLTHTGLPAPAVAAVRSSVSGGVAVAHATGSAALLTMVRTAFTGGMDVMLWASAGIAIASALLALAFLPRRSGPPPEPTPTQEPHPAQLGA